MENKTENKYYLRIQGEKFGFVVEGLHILDESIDHKISTEDYNRFFELQSEGKQFRAKENPTGTGLFDLIEEYIPEQIEEVPSEPTLEERVVALEQVLQQTIEKLNLL